MSGHNSHPAAAANSFYSLGPNQTLGGENQTRMLPGPYYSICRVKN